MTHDVDRAFFEAVDERAAALAHKLWEVIGTEARDDASMWREEEANAHAAVAGLAWLIVSRMVAWNGAEPEVDGPVGKDHFLASRKADEEGRP